MPTRVYEIAQLIGANPSVLVEKLRSLGFLVKSPASALSDDEYDRFKISALRDWSQQCLTSEDLMTFGDTDDIPFGVEEEDSGFGTAEGKICSNCHGTGSVHSERGATEFEAPSDYPGDNGFYGKCPVCNGSGFEIA